MPVSLQVVDAFTDRPFAGNPAAVCLLDDPRPDEWLAAVAREMNLSETAFLWPEEGGLRLRWFTPAVEVDLCGHGTLASAHVLWESGRLAPEEPARFLTRSGPLRARRIEGRIELDFPAVPAHRCEAPADLERALHVAPGHVLESRFDYLVEVETDAAVRTMAPDLALLAEYPVRGIIVTARSSGPYDFVSRFFAPRAGVPEDPVTGSAHCTLGPYWAHILGRSDLVGYQASARGGVVRVRCAGDRVFLGGQAVTVWSGILQNG